MKAAIQNKMLKAHTNDAVGIEAINSIVDALNASCQEQYMAAKNMVCFLTTKKNELCCT